LHFGKGRRSNTVDPSDGLCTETIFPVRSNPVTPSLYSAPGRDPVCEAVMFGFAALLIASFSAIILLAHVIEAYRNH
jgi:hypothetical protein